MHIDRYEFGLIIIDGQTYHHDLLLWPGEIKSDWWRGESHLLQLEDVMEALAADPQVLVVGKGAYGRLEVATPLASHLKRQGIELVAVPTGEAAQVINQLAGKRRLAAALHLTC